nr:Smr/MutS family protein [uncultured Arsenicibacter sp.]
MNIGDKIRMLRAKEQGVITRFLSGNQVEIEIEDGFRIPVMRSEIVVVSPMETERLVKPAGITPQKQVTSSNIVSNNGVYLAFVAQNDREFALHLVNNTDWDLPFAVAEERGSMVNGLHNGILRGKTQVKLNEMYSFSTFDDWPTFLVQVIWSRAGRNAFRAPLVKRVKCRAQTFHTSKSTVPVLNQSGHLYQLDDDKETAPQNVQTARPVTVKPEQLKAEMLKPKGEPAASLSFERPSAVIDLHVEALLPKGQGNRSNAELLELQLTTFEKSLEDAIATGMNEITFIHGVGSGTLRTEIHRRLGRHPHIRFFEDAQKQKFGYGATKVSIK